MERGQGEVCQSRSSPSPAAEGMGRFSLLALTAMVALINAPFIARYYVPGYDGKLALGVFDYMYSGWLFDGALPQWMAYGLDGLDAAAFHISFLSASSYLTIFSGKLLGIKDSLALFAFTLCLEQFLYLLGFYLLSGRLFRERLTRFCVCLTAVGLVSWQSQPFFNLRLFGLLPLAFYLLLRVRDDRAGWCGWLAGVVAILGPEGSSYAYVLWALVLTLFSVAIFWGRFRSVAVLFQPQTANLLAVLAFIGLAIAFSGTLWHALDNSVFGSPGRDNAGKVSLGAFLTYGGTHLPSMLSALLFPSAFIEDVTGRAGMSDYVGLLTIFCLPLTARAWRNLPMARPFALVAVVISALSLGGLFATAIYFLPGMHLYRHLSFLTGVIRMLALILAGFGCDALVQSVRHGTLFPRPSFATLLVIALGLVFYVDLNIGGVAWATVCEDVRRNATQVLGTLETDAAGTLVRAVVMFLFALSVWRLCRAAHPPDARKLHFSLTLLVLCILVDCGLFQRELYGHLYRSDKQAIFPATPLRWPFVRPQPANGLVRNAQETNSVTRLFCDLAPFETVPSEIAQKYQVWKSVPGYEQQISLSCALQWDPIHAAYRADWTAKNVAQVRRVLAKNNPKALPLLFGEGGLKFRLFPESSVIPVSSDSEALGLLGARTGWENQVILTDPDRVVGTNDVSRTPSTSQLQLGAYSPNAFTLCLWNGSAQPAWLVYAEANTPGWHASVNGRMVPILNAYGAFKAVRVSPGANQVHFTYHAGLHSVSFRLFTAMAAAWVSAALTALLWIAAHECLDLRRPARISSGSTRSDNARRPLRKPALVPVELGGPSLRQ